MTRVVLIFVTASFACPANCAADSSEFQKPAASFLKQFCVDCHGDGAAEANVSLEQLAAAPDLTVKFKLWQRVADMLDKGLMPPEDAEQPTTKQRARLVKLILSQLDQTAKEFAGDPGRVALRRLTRAEYEYTIFDLTGLNLSMDTILAEDAAGGEGFANVGDVQFVQDSTLERYLDAAKLVASHAIVGAGPLHFFSDPGQTGLELSAINRIQSIYRQHGFRTASGEGGEPYGLDKYPRAFYVAWLYRNRAQLDAASTSLKEFASQENISLRFAEHIRSVLDQDSHSYPLSNIVANWRSIPAPSAADPAAKVKAREACVQLVGQVRRWQNQLAATAGDDEEAALMANGTVQLQPTQMFDADSRWSPDAKSSPIALSVSSALDDDISDAVIHWKDPTIRFRGDDAEWTERQTLRSVVSLKQSKAFGPHPQVSAVGADDLVFIGAKTLTLDIQAPPGMTRADIDVEAKLLAQSGDHVVRCTIEDRSEHRETEADTGRVSALLAKRDGAAAVKWQRVADEFAKALPQISHREPAPSDRDPIPPPYDSTYNNDERNEFHYKIKYHRDDHFLVQCMLDDDTKRSLDEAWHDLLTSFDYHDQFLRFVRRKLEVKVGGIASLDDQQIASLPTNSRKIVGELFHGYHQSREARLAARKRHVDEAIRFAERAWRRPLTADENRRLRTFYRTALEPTAPVRPQVTAKAPTDSPDALEIDPHDQAVRALIARILVAPAFLYRIEETPSRQLAELSSWELANRLSYFLWSSPPDSELRRLAASGELQRPTILRQQVTRMLRDGKSRRFATEFFGQWFGFYRFDDFRGIDNEQFATFTPSLKQDLYSEANAFFSHIVRENRPINEILFADYTFLTHQLARHYGVSDADTAELSTSPTRVNGVNDIQRGGLFGLGTIHAITSAPLRTSAVKRGDWILRRVLGTPVPSPPADAGSIPADEVLADGKTVRQRLEAHRQDITCANCHDRIDPLGFALENFDPIGRWRTEYRDGKPIDSTGTLNDGTFINGPTGLRDYLRREQRQFHGTLSRRLLGYALGRSELLTDRELVEKMTSILSHGGGVLELADAIVQSKQFRMRRGATDSNLGPSHR